MLMNETQKLGSGGDIHKQEQSFSSLDPDDDWDEFREVAHRLIDVCIDHLRSARARPVWRPVPEATKEALLSPPPWQGRHLDEVVADFESSILPYPTGNTHPRFYGWVHGTGTAAGMLAELCAAAMNSNCGGRDHAAVYVERAVIEWCRQIFGFPPGASGVLTSSTSAATVIALAAARTACLGRDSRATGLHDAPRLMAYASAEAHSAITKAMELLGLGSGALRMILVDRNFALDIGALRASVEQDRQNGLLPFCIIATAGSVNVGSFDPIDELADLCESEGIWLHVDGAFGAWLRLASPALQGLTRGIERANSLAFDFHKWMYVQYDCGCVLVRDEGAHRAAFAARPEYLVAKGAGLAGGDPWYCDYGIDLSRGFRALKVWFTLQHYGLCRLGEKITENCGQAHHMAMLVRRYKRLDLLVEPQSNICCFRYNDGASTDQQLDRLNEAIAIDLQERGIVAFSTTRIAGRVALRAAIVNHRTELGDVETAVEAVLAAGDALASKASEAGRCGLGGSPMSDALHPADPPGDRVSGVPPARIIAGLAPTVLDHAGSGFRALLKCLTPPTKPRVLDVGAGGFLGETTTVHLLDVLDARIDAVENNPDRARALQQKFGSRVSVFAEDFGNFDTAELYDLIVFDLDSDLIGAQYERFLPITSRMLKPKGIIIASLIYDSAVAYDPASDLLSPGGRPAYEAFLKRYFGTLKLTSNILDYRLFGEGFAVLGLVDKWMAERPQALGWLALEKMPIAPPAAAVSVAESDVIRELVPEVEDHHNSGFRAVLKCLSLPAKPRVLDVGAGGFLGKTTTVHVLDLFDARVDAVERNADRASALQQEFATRLNVFAVDFKDFSPDYSYDLMIFDLDSNMIATQFEEFLPIAAKMLAPGGKIISLILYNSAAAFNPGSGLNPAGKRDYEAFLMRYFGTVAINPRTAAHRLSAEGFAVLGMVDNMMGCGPGYAAWMALEKTG